MCRFSLTLLLDVMSRFDHHTLIDEVSINNNPNPTLKTKKKRGGRCAIFTGFFLDAHVYRYPFHTPVTSCWPLPSDGQNHHWGRRFNFDIIFVKWFLEIAFKSLRTKVIMTWKKCWRDIVVASWLLHSRLLRRRCFTWWWISDYCIWSTGSYSS